MKNPFWTAIAAIVTIPLVKVWLVDRAQRTPYSNITSGDGKDVYMYRYWLFNPYSEDRGIKTGSGSENDNRCLAWLPSVRIHHIMRADSDRHFHDHPWNARTIILDGCYWEQRPCGPGATVTCRRIPGDTQTLKFGEYHRISQVSEGGVWTLFITWKYRGTWGFEVDGAKVPWRQYLGIEEKQ